MKTFFKFVLYTTSFWAFFIMTLPKKTLYAYGTQQIQNYNPLFKTTQKSITQTPFSLQIQQFSAAAASAQKVQLNLFLIFNTLKLQKIKTPLLNLKNINFKQWGLVFFTIDAKHKNGIFKGYFNGLFKTLKITFYGQKLPTNLERFFKKQGKIYVYENRF